METTNRYLTIPEKWKLAELYVVVMKDCAEETEKIVERMKTEEYKISATEKQKGEDYNKVVKLNQRVKDLSDLCHNYEAQNIVPLMKGHVMPQKPNEVWMQ